MGRSWRRSQVQQGLAVEKGIVSQHHGAPSDKGKANSLADLRGELYVAVERRAVDGYFFCGAVSKS